MNQTHIHLLITHLPIFGSMLGGIVLLQSIWMKSNATKIAAYTLLIISALGAGVAYLTGESAEESAENLPGVLDSAIKSHEEFALFALISLIVLGASSIVGMYITFKNLNVTRTTAIVIFFFTLFSAGIAARTGYLGGQIRHTEITDEGIKKRAIDHDD